jgi:SAM-dependent methyltransferase
MRETDEKFLEVARQSASLLARYGLQPDQSILDVGCGYGRLSFGLLDVIGFKGRYEGFDLLPRHIAWCTDEISSRHPNFTFRHADIANARYNPRGRVEAARFRFPFRRASFDFCALFSVFTHMYESDIGHYIEQIRRVLGRGGTCLATFFLFTEDRLDAVTSDRSSLPMRHELNRVTRFFNDADPLHAISYDLDHVARLWTSAGFEVADVVWGSWAGDSTEPAERSLNTYQDVIVLKR